MAELRYRSSDKDARGAAARGNGMIVTFARDRGKVFHAGSSEWVAGLQARDFYTETITRNVLKHFIDES
jgi:hypothetical protein